MEIGSGLLESETGEEYAVPALLLELPSRRQVFVRNLLDLLRPRQEPPLRLASKPALFWTDVFVASPLPWGSFSESALCHGLLVFMLVGSSLLWPRRPQLTAPPASNHEEVIYYQASELLPPLDTGRTPSKPTTRGEPAYAPQPIISVPAEADNRRQTIVAPPKLKLDRDVPLPNIVSAPSAPLAVPIAATERKTLSQAPTLNAPVVEPPPDVKLASSRNAVRSLQEAAVQPAPVLHSAARRAGDVNFAPAEVVAPAPLLTVPAQQVPAGRAALGGVAAVVPPPPSISGSGMAKSGGRLIALSIHPAMASAKLEAPAGNRRGSFAATPQGKAGAAGTPDVAGTDHAPGSTNSGSRNDAPAGLYVGAGSNPKSSAIGGNGQGSANDGGTDSSGRSKDSVLMAKATPPRVSSTPQRQAEAVSGNGESDLEKKVFGDRKFYSMTLNIPNLNSAGGSWVVHFAELNGVDVKNQGNLTAPSPTIMSDPAYPLELMKQHVQGTVTLYAIIGSDGSVSGVRVLNGVDDRLDQYASEALQRWHFRPATKDGSPVALEAVVKIPFRAARMRSSF